jgi:hypothetical protein
LSKKLGKTFTLPQESDKKVNETIELLDIFEELRPLTLEEWNLRDLLKSHIISLLQNQRVY